MESPQLPTRSAAWSDPNYCGDVLSQAQQLLAELHLEDLHPLYATRDTCHLGDVSKLSQWQLLTRKIAATHNLTHARSAELLSGFEEMGDNWIEGMDRQLEAHSGQVLENIRGVCSDGNAHQAALTACGVINAHNPQGEDRRVSELLDPSWENTWGCGDFTKGTNTSGVSTLLNHLLETNVAAGANIWTQAQSDQSEAQKTARHIEESSRASTSNPNKSQSVAPYLSLGHSQQGLAKGATGIPNEEAWDDHSAVLVVECPAVSISDATTVNICAQHMLQGGPQQHCLEQDQLLERVDSLGLQCRLRWAVSIWRGALLCQYVQLENASFHVRWRKLIRAWSAWRKVAQNTKLELLLREQETQALQEEKLLWIADKARGFRVLRTHLRLWQAQTQKTTRMRVLDTERATNRAKMHSLLKNAHATLHSVGTALEAEPRCVLSYQTKLVHADGSTSVVHVRSHPASPVTYPQPALKNEDTNAHHPFEMAPRTNRLREEKGVLQTTSTTQKAGRSAPSSCTKENRDAGITVADHFKHWSGAPVDPRMSDGHEVQSHCGHAIDNKSSQHPRSGSANTIQPHPSLDCMLTGAKDPGEQFKPCSVVSNTRQRVEQVSLGKPTILLALEARAKQRHQQRKELKRQYEEKETQQQNELAACEAQRLRHEKAEKQVARDQQLQAVRTQREEEEKWLQVKRVLKEQNTLAHLHYLRGLILRYGWLPWRALVNSRERQVNAASYLRQHTLNWRALHGWREYTDVRLKTRTSAFHALKTLYTHHLLSAGKMAFQRWAELKHRHTQFIFRKAFALWHAAKGAGDHDPMAVQHSTTQLLIHIVHCWHLDAKSRRRAREIQTRVLEVKVKSFSDRSRCQRAIQIWTSHLANQQRVKSKKQILQKVQGWLEQYELRGVKEEASEMTLDTDAFQGSWPGVLLGWTT